MHFDKNIPIYIQIEGFIQDKIIHNVWRPAERIPSVREMAEILEVNPNTVMRSFERLEREQIIYNQRGVGFFVSEEAAVKIKLIRSRLFFEQLPQLFNTMKALNISMEAVVANWADFNNIKKDLK